MANMNSFAVSSPFLLPLCGGARASTPPAEERTTFRTRASTPPAEERVTSFFARAKKEVTKKESTCVAPEEGLHGKSAMSRSARSNRSVAELALSSSNSLGTQSCHTSIFLDEHVRAICAGFPRMCADPLKAPRNVLSFLVTSFFARAKKEVTRSSAGGVEAVALRVKALSLKKTKIDSRFRGNDGHAGTKQERSPCVG